jgi:hypothetical protein
MRKIAAFLFLCALPCVASAQQGKSEKGGLYSFPYKGDTWTGEIVSTDPNTREISLQYTSKKGEAEKFTAKLLPGFKAYVKDHPEQKVSGVNLGDKIIAYYVAVGQKYPITDEQGKRKDIVATENMVFEVEVIPPKKDKK